MKKAAKLCIVLLLLTVALSLVFVVSAQSDVISNAKSENINAYLSIVDAYKAGASIDELVLQLNHAINLTMQAQFLSNVNPGQAEALAVEAQQLAQEVVFNWKVHFCQFLFRDHIGKGCFDEQLDVLYLDPF